MYVFVEKELVMSLNLYTTALSSPNVLTHYYSKFQQTALDQAQEKRKYTFFLIKLLMSLLGMR